MKPTYFILLLATLSAFHLRQAKHLKFDNSSVTWKQKSAPVQDSILQMYYFTNISNEPVTIVEVRPSCTCTTPAYTKTPVAKNGKGYVQLSTTVGKLRETHKVDAVIKTIDRNNRKNYYKIELIYGGG